MNSMGETLVRSMYLFHLIKNDTIWLFLKKGYIYISVLSYKKFIYFNYLIHCTGWQLVINMYKVTNYLKIVTNNKLLDDRSL